MRELSAGSLIAGTDLRVGAYVIDPEARLLMRAGEPVHLSPKAFELLSLLAEHRSQPVPTREIRARLWGGRNVTREMLAKLVMQIRAAIGDDARAPRYLRTLRGYGFMLSARDVPRPAPHEAAPSRYRLRWTGRDIPLREGATLIGYSGEAEIRVPSPTISDRHARLWVAGPAAVIEDLGSENGTFVGDRRVKASLPLQDGDQIRLGAVGMTFLEGPVPSDAER
jgi:DNA-binding winged helix-turn-helix (wHTH) protein